MQQVNRKKPRSYQATLPVTDYQGRNSFGNHSALKAGESRELINWNIFTGNGKPYLAHRGGSAFLKKASGPTKRGSTGVINAITWDVGSEEYLITQEGASFYFQALLTTGNSAVIQTPAAGSFVVSAATPADMFLSGDRLYVFHPGGNKIIDWTGTTFVGYEMGMPYPYIISVDVNSSGVVTGSYTMGVELVYRVSGIDRMASTPNRKIYSTRILAQTGTITAKKISLTLDATVLAADTLWTHVRVWRSKNKNVDYSDPLQPIDAQGKDDELYEEAIITRAELGAGSVTAIATGATLPVGNAGVAAGKPAEYYQITLNNLDSVFSTLLGIDRIELLPLPAGLTGCYLGNKIFVSNITDSTLDDQSKNNIYYSLFAGTKYHAQYDPLNFIDTGRDGQNMIRLIAFEKDLIGIKESMTGRLVGGNVDMEFETLDFRIGISTKNQAAYIPGLGIAAITNDNSDFRIFGYDFKWSSTFNGQEISLPVRAEMAVATASLISFAYCNGKLFVNLGLGYLYVLHHKEGRGWTVFNYPQTYTERLFTFYNGRRAALVSRSTHLVEIELAATLVDVNTSTDVTTELISLYEWTYRFQSNDGRDNLEPDFLAVAAQLSAPLVGTPYVNGLPWSDAVNQSYTNFVPDPAIYGASTDLADAEYRLYIAPVTVGNMPWCRLRGSFIHYKLVTTAPALMRSKSLNVVIDEDGMAFGEFDPFQRLLVTQKLPDWNANTLLVFNFDDDSTTLYDQSGNGLNHTWAAIGSRAHVSSLPPRGGESATGALGSGWYRSAYTAMTYIGDAAGLNSEDLAYRWCLNCPSLAAVVYVQGGGSGPAGNYYWVCKVNTDGSLEFQLYTSALSYKWKTATGVIVAGATEYTILFFLTGSGATGQFYVATRSAAATAAKTTTRTALTPASPYPVSSEVLRSSTAKLSHAGLYRVTGSAALAASLHNEFKDLA